MSPDDRLLELALLYLGLARGSDGRLNFHEFAAISGLLDAWRTGSEMPGVAQVVDDAVRVYDPVRVLQAVETLGHALSEGEKRRALEQMSEVALADRRFLKTEAEFIGRVAKEWGVHPPADGQGAFWTVLRSRDVESARRTAMDLATLYIAVAVEPDGDLSDAELEVITARVGQWLPNLPTGPLDVLVREALAEYGTPMDGERLSGLVDRLRRVLPAHQVTALARDLRAIAQADGAWSVESRSWVDRIETLLD